MTLESGIFKALYLGSTDLKKNEISKVNGHNCENGPCRGGPACRSPKVITGLAADPTGPRLRRAQTRFDKPDQPVGRSPNIDSSENHFDTSANGFSIGRQPLPVTEGGQDGLAYGPHTHPSARFRVWDPLPTTPRSPPSPRLYNQPSTVHSRSGP